MAQRLGRKLGSNSPQEIKDLWGAQTSLYLLGTECMRLDAALCRTCLGTTFRSLPGVDSRRKGRGNNPTAQHSRHHRHCPSIGLHFETVARRRHPDPSPRPFWPQPLHSCGRNCHLSAKLLNRDRAIGSRAGQFALHPLRVWILLCTIGLPFDPQRTSLPAPP